VIWQTTCTCFEGEERNRVPKALKRRQWTLSGPSGAAARLGLNRPALHFRMKKLGIVRSVYAGFEQ
jgi:formate hydrogenlyase transcriptional activator